MDLRTRLHNWIDTEAARLHHELDEIFAREDRAASHGGELLRVMIDAGHGGTDPGAEAGGLRESDIVLVYAKALEDELFNRDIPVGMTRSDDTFITLGERAAQANQWPATCFISLHANAASAPAANGAWIIHAKGSEEGFNLAFECWQELAGIPGIADDDEAVEIYEDESPWVGGRRLAVLRQTQMPAILVELGFITNDSDREQLTDPEMPPQVAKALADGIVAWYETR